MASLNKNQLILDFSQADFRLPQTQIDWQKSIIDFIESFLNDKEEIAVQTSGSTGAPKTIQLLKKDMLLSAELTGEFLNLKKGNTALLAMPVSYIAGKMMVIRAIHLGLKLICIQPKIELYEVSAMIHFCALTPMQAIQNKKLLEHCKTIILGGSPFTELIQKELKDFPCDIFETYGMTETITHIAMRNIKTEVYFKTLPEMKISVNANSCLRIETPYQHSIVETNDIVELKSETEFKILGRLDNVINSGGLKIQPEQIEAELKKYFSENFIIHSIPDVILGQKVVLIFEGKFNKAIEPEKWNLPNNKKPKAYFTIDSFPRTDSGKIKRNAISLNDLRPIL